MHPVRIVSYRAELAVTVRVLGWFVHSIHRAEETCPTLLRRPEMNRHRKRCNKREA